MIRIPLAALALACASVAHADDAPPSACIDVSIPKGVIAQHDGKWIELTQDQWKFLRGIFVLHPDTAPGLPFGDRAAMATRPDRSGGLVFFLDGDKACSPMPVPRELVDMLGDVAAGVIRHEGAKL